MIIKVSPKEVIKTYTVDKIDVSISNLVLDESVTINILLIDSTDQLIESINITLDGEEYHQWSTDDSYIIDKILQLLNLEKV